MNKKEKIKNKNFSRKNNKLQLTTNITVYLILRITVIVCMVAQCLHGNWNNVFLCILTLILFTLPNLISNKFNIELPNTLEIVVYLFIFSSEILGEIQNFYGVIPHWDTMLHTLNGFLCAAVGFSLVDLLNTNENIRFYLTPGFVAIVGFCFSLTIGVLWEFGEFAADRYLLKDMQKDRIITQISSVKINEEKENIPVIIKDINKTKIYSNNNKDITTIEGGYLDIGLIDTIKDMFVNFLGAIVFSFIGYFYIKNRDKYTLAKKFIPLKKTKKS